MEKLQILTILQEGDLSISGQFMESSNYTFLGKVSGQGEQFPVVYKPQKGETPLWDFPTGTLCKREVAAFVVSELLGWDLVPATVFRREGSLGKGSLQLFVDNDPDRHYFSFNQETKERLRPTTLFDLIINNADRKGSHILLDERDHLWLVDHGVCFHQEYKLRTVVWDFAGQTIPEPLLADIHRVNQLITENHATLKELRHWLSTIEVQALQARIEMIQQMKTFPFPDKNRRVFPWPPL
jgi:hypothetical protein